MHYAHLRYRAAGVPSISQALLTAIHELGDPDLARLDAEVLLAHSLHKPRSYLHAWPEARLDAAQLHKFQQYINQRVQGVPIAYLTGQREFWSLNFNVTADTLIPRPETELLVEQVLALPLTSQHPCIADLGTGSGAIAVALAHERPDWQVLAIDRSHSCLQIARDNAVLNGVNNVMPVLGHWCEALADESVDVLVSNPPYVADQDPHLQRGDVRFEPITALAAGSDGLSDIRQIIPLAIRVLRPGGWLALEHAPEQAEKIHNLLNNNNYSSITGERDLAGHQRTSMGQKQP